MPVQDLGRAGSWRYAAKIRFGVSTTLAGMLKRRWSFARRRPLWNHPGVSMTKSGYRCLVLCELMGYLHD